MKAYLQIPSNATFTSYPTAWHYTAYETPNIIGSGVFYSLLSRSNVWQTPSM
jgi:hypothetical protein